MRIEPLEDRVNPVSIVVSTTDDLLNFPSTSDGPFSLRDAIVYSNEFAEQNLISVPEGTFTLTRTGANEDAGHTGDLDIIGNGGGWIEIHGAGADKTIIDAAGIDRVFDVLPGAKLFVFNATIRGGVASNGGGIHARGQLAVHWSVVRDNTATLRGGGIDINETGVQFASQETLYENNFAGTSETGGGLGGAINNGGGSIQVNDAVFRNNRTGTLGSGGAVYSRSGLFIAITSEFDQNRSGMGGAAATSGGNANFVESTFIGNVAEFSGASAAPMGGAIYGQGEVYIERSTFTQNVAIGFGRGGALMNTAYMSVVNSTISGNIAGATGKYGAGAGIANSGGFELIHSTVTKNMTLGGGFGDGVMNVASGSNFMILNTIVAQNGVIPGNNGPDTYGNFTSRGGNLIGLKAGSNGWISTDQVGQSGSLNARLGPLQNNGGPTATHALRFGSIAIDRGVNDFYVANTGGVDQRGNPNLSPPTSPRVVNGYPDAGAYELQPRSNDAPIGEDDEYSVLEDGTLTVVTADGILSNDSDPDGDIMDVVIVSWPSWAAQFTIFSDGAFTYRTLANFHGTDSFTYRATDGALQSELITVTINIQPVNDAPTAKNDSYSVNEDTTLRIPMPGVAGILANDTDIDGDVLNAELLSRPTHGMLSLNANGSFEYTPDENWHGTDKFTYRAFDGTAYSAPATVTINVNPVNDAPVATDDLVFFTNEDQAVSGQVTASDVDGNTLTFSVDSQPTWGSLNLASNGMFTYTPYTNFHGGDTFAFRVSDGLASDTATVLVIVAPVNDAPVAYNVNVDMDEDESVSNKYFSTFDIDGDDLSFEVLPHNNPGDFTYSATEGSFAYTPPPNFHGVLVYHYKANDGEFDSNEATVTITV